MSLSRNSSSGGLPRLEGSSLVYYNIFVTFPACVPTFTGCWSRGFVWSSSFSRWQLFLPRGARQVTSPPLRKGNIQGLLKPMIRWVLRACCKKTEVFFGYYWMKLLLDTAQTFLWVFSLPVEARRFLIFASICIHTTLASPKHFNSAISVRLNWASSVSGFSPPMGFPCVASVFRSPVQDVLWSKQLSAIAIVVVEVPKQLLCRALRVWSPGWDAFKRWSQPEAYDVYYRVLRVSALLGYTGCSRFSLLFQLSILLV